MYTVSCLEGGMCQSSRTTSRPTVRRRPATTSAFSHLTLRPSDQPSARPTAPKSVSTAAMRWGGQG